LTERPHHLTAAEVAAYLDRDLGNEARARVEEHLDACAACRAELATSMDVADSWRASPAKPEQQTRASRWRIAALATPLALAAAGLALMILPRAPGRGSEASALRAGDMSEGRGAIEAVEPLPNSEIASTNSKFVWRKVPASVYRLAVMTETGDSVYVTDTQDTSVVLPPSVHLEPGQNYFWSVVGIDNGVESTTHAQSFRIRK